MLSRPPSLVLRWAYRSAFAAAPLTPERLVCSRLQRREPNMAALPFTTDTHPLIRHLASVATLSEDDKRALLTLPMQVTELRADQDIVREGDRPTRSCLILEGWASTFKMTGEGKRQI